MSISSITSHL